MRLRLLADLWHSPSAHVAAPRNPDVTPTSGAFNVAFDLDPAWFEQQRKFAKLARPPGTRIRKDRERLLIGYVDGVLIVAFPGLEVSTVAAGAGEDWLSLNPHRLSLFLATFKGAVRLAVGPQFVSVGGSRQPHGSFDLRLGADDPELVQLTARLEEIAAEQCYRNLVAATEAARERDQAIEWHRAADAVNAAPLVEQIREQSVIVFRLPEAPPESPSQRAVVDQKQIAGHKVFLHCHTFRGERLTVDPRWVTHVGW